MDLVVGATGVVGKQIALKLAEQGRTVRAMARGGASRAEAKPLLDAGIEIVEGDVTRPDTLPPACAGIEIVLCTVTSMPHGRDDGLRRVDLDGTLALIGAAESAGARKFVYTSYSGNIQEDCPLTTAKRSCENRLLASTMSAVILRPSYFMEAWLSPHLGFEPGNGKARICGSGEGKVSYISALNVVDYAAAAVAKTGTGNTVIEMGGPEALSQLDAVRVFEEVLGKKFALDRVPIETIEQQHQSTDPLQKSFAALMLTYARGDEIPMSRTNAEHYGIKLRSVADHVRTFC